MTTLKEQEGYLLIDHRNSPGIKGLPPVLEIATFTCKHCQRIVIKNPDRQRERTFCRGCQHLICDNCAAIKAQTLTCRTFDQVVDELLTKELSNGC